jgi:hypothetical protein
MRESLRRELDIRRARLIELGLPDPADPTAEWRHAQLEDLLDVDDLPEPELDAYTRALLYDQTDLLERALVAGDPRAIEELLGRGGDEEE